MLFEHSQSKCKVERRLGSESDVSMHILHCIATRYAMSRSLVKLTGIGTHGGVARQ